jgi:hypothetical protein
MSNNDIYIFYRFFSQVAIPSGGNVALGATQAENHSSTILQSACPPGFGG